MNYFRLNQLKSLGGECEIWDMFGVFFLNHSNLTRLHITVFKVILKKDFPLSGFTESINRVMKILS
jgi:NADH:ubiquinone oxidoreductase subunit C